MIAQYLPGFAPSPRGQRRPMTRRNDLLRAEARSATFRIACVESAAQALGTLQRGCRMIGLTKGQFSMLDLIRAVLAQTGPADLVLSTWTMGIRDTENARWLVDTGEIRSFRLLTDRSFVTRQPRYCRRLVELFGEQCIRASRTHAKFALIRNESWSICIRGSMNLNRNERWENFDLDESAELCDFFEGLVAELERLTPPGPAPGESVVQDAFHRALETATCGDRQLAELTPREKWARMGYTRGEIEDREDAQGDDVRRGQHALEDQWREATIAEALGGNAGAREIVGRWIHAQREGL